MQTTLTKCATEAHNENASPDCLNDLGRRRLAQDYSSIPGTSFRNHWSGGPPAGSYLPLVRWWSGWLCSAWAQLSVAMPDSAAGSVSRLCRAQNLGPPRVYRGLALLADLDRGAGFELYRRWILYHAVLVSTGAGMGLVRGVLRDYFWSECYLHALFCRRGVLVLAGQSGHYHRLYHPRWGGDFRLYSDAGWLARAGAE